MTHTISCLSLCLFPWVHDHFLCLSLSTSFTLAAQERVKRRLLNKSLCSNFLLFSLCHISKQRAIRRLLYLLLGERQRAAAIGWMFRRHAGMQIQMFAGCFCPGEGGAEAPYGPHGAPPLLQARPTQATLYLQYCTVAKLYREKKFCAQSENWNTPWQLWSLDGTRMRAQIYHSALPMQPLSSWFVITHVRTIFFLLGADPLKILSAQMWVVQRQGLHEGQTPNEGQIW